MAEGSQHFTNLFAVLVGVTSSSRKGSSWAHVLRLFRMIDINWVTKSIQSGFSSGEGLVWAVRDPIWKLDAIRDKRNGRVEDYQNVMTDSGISDKRLLAFEGEFASPLRVMGRDGSTLSVMIRLAWDSGILQTTSKNSPAIATDPLISFVGHITRDELRRELTTTDMANSFANRFLWVCTARSKRLPEGGNLTAEDFAPLVKRFKDAMAFAQTVGEMKRDPAIKELWARTYDKLTAGRMGLLGAITSRAEAQTMRLACLYALLDKSAVVREKHLMAAVALWEYCYASARFIFGQDLGDPTADTILQGLRDAPDGLDRTAISSLFARHKSGEEISRALTVLQGQGRVAATRTSQGVTGRPSEIWRAVGGTAN
jgi:hypothetical protein